ncbi:MAG TPA: YcnI family protein [Solirubrobacter sp.]|nr:YcnI family protein [Solirubrobacter sp.]
MRVSIVAAATTAVAAAVLAAPAAQAHVTLNPRAVTADAYARLDVRVPNERDKAGTKTVVVHFPSGFYSASYKRVWGWTATVKMRKLSTPVQSEDGPITKEVGKITWRATRKSNWILPGQFEEFGLSMKIPNVPGTTLTFPSVQTYSNGEVVKWNGGAGSESPAPTVTVNAAS